MKLSKRRIIFLAVIAFLLVCASVCAIIMGSFGNVLQSQQAAHRFKGASDERYSQLSAFFPVGSEIELYDVYSFRQSVDSSLVAASLSAPENGSLYMDAFSSKTELTIFSDKDSATASVIGVGGKYFNFHPLRLRSGNYITESDLMHDTVILDEELAWRLFGSVDLAGMTVYIGDNPYVIAGVVERETDFADVKAYSDGAGMYMHYDTLNELTGAKISCYELTVADPISGFAYDMVQNGFASATVVENSSRYRLSSLFSVIGDFGIRSMNTSAVIFPYWENAARYLEDWCALLLLLTICFLLLPVITAIVYAVIFIRKLSKKIKARIPELARQHRERSYERRRLMSRKGAHTRG